MVDEPASRYPYADDGRVAVPAEADWLDSMVALSFAAAATSTIRLATGVLVLPEHNPVVVAKQAASLDALSGGRLTLGVGVGWSREEFDALGVPFARRGARTAEYVAAIRTLWRDDVATFDGEFGRFAAIRVNPKPVQGRIPVVLGGNSDAALRRAAAGRHAARRRRGAARGPGRSARLDAHARRPLEGRGADVAAGRRGGAPGEPGRRPPPAT
jgi:probable F420-dependent oxidoreductase